MSDPQTTSILAALRDTRNAGHLNAAAADEIERLRKFIQQVADAPDAMVCRLTRDAAKEILDGI